MEDHKYVEISLEDKIKPLVGRALNPSERPIWTHIDYMIQPSNGMPGMWYWEINPKVHEGRCTGWGNASTAAIASEIAIFTYQKIMEEKNGRSQISTDQ